MMEDRLEVPIGASKDVPEIIDWLREHKIGFRVKAGHDEGRLSAKIKFDNDLALMLYRLRSKKLID